MIKVIESVSLFKLPHLSTRANFKKLILYTFPPTAKSFGIICIVVGVAGGVTALSLNTLLGVPPNLTNILVAAANLSSQVAVL